MVEKEFIKTYARSIVEEAKKKGVITTYADFCKTKESKESRLFKNSKATITPEMVLKEL